MKKGDKVTVLPQALKKRWTDQAIIDRFNLTGPGEIINTLDVGGIPQRLQVHWLSSNGNDICEWYDIGEVTRYVDPKHNLFRQITVDTIPTHIHDCVQASLDLAKEYDCTVVFMFNGTPVECLPSDTIGQIYKRWEIARSKS